jgi:cytochrome P450
LIDRVTEEVTIADIAIPAGSVVALCLATTNLDDGKRHRSFGAGVHRCLGEALARMELTVIVAEWLRAVPDSELAPNFAPGFMFTQGGAVAPSSLPLRWPSQAR